MVSCAGELWRGHLSIDRSCLRGRHGTASARSARESDNFRAAGEHPVVTMILSDEAQRELTSAANALVQSSVSCLFAITPEQLKRITSVRCRIETAQAAERK